MPANPLYDFTIGLAVNQRDMARSIQKQEAVLKKIYNSAMTSAVEAGFSRRSLRGLETTMAAASKKMVATQREIVILGEKLKEKGLTAELKERHKASLEELKIKRKFLREEATSHRSNAQDAAKEYAKELAKSKVRAGRRKVATDKMAAGFKGGKGFGEGLQKLMSQIRGADAAGAASTFGKGTKKAGGLAKKGVGKLPGGGKMLKAFSKIGGLMAKLGPILMAVGAIAGAFIAIIKLLLDAEAKVKEFRQELIKSNVSALDLGASMYGVGKAVDEVVFAFSGLGKGFDFQRAWGVNTKEALKVVDAYAQAGVKVSEFTAGLSKADARQDALRKSTEAALTYASLLGMQASEVAQKMGEMMGNMAQSLSGVRMQFSGLTAIAKESAYSTKKFFSQVLQATSGMTMYNVRLEETGVLLKELQKALGAKDGFDLLQKILGGLQGKSMKERVKGDEVKGLGNVRRIRQRGAIERAKDFSDVAGPGFMATMQAAADKLGLKVDTGTPKALMKTLSRLSEADIGKLRVSIEEMAKGNKEFEKHLVGLPKLFRAALSFRGGSKLKGRAALAMSEGEVGPIAALEEIRLLIKKGQSLGKDNMAIGRMITEELGVDLGTANKVMDFFNRADAHFQLLLERAKGKGKGELGTKAHDEAAKMGMFYDWNEKLGKYLLREGTKEKPGEVATEQTMYYAQADAFQKLVEKGKETEDIKLAKEIAGATTKTTKVLEQMMDGVLANIFKYTSMIFGWLLKSDEELESEALTTLLEKLAQKRSAIEGKLPGLLTKLEKVESLGKRIDDPAGKAKVIAEKERIEGVIKAVREEVSIRNAEMAEIQDRHMKGMLPKLESNWTDMDSTDKADWMRTVLKGSGTKKGSGATTNYKGMISGREGTGSLGDEVKFHDTDANRMLGKVERATTKVDESIISLEALIKRQHLEDLSRRNQELAAAGVAGQVFAALPEATKHKLPLGTVESLIRDIMDGKISKSTANALRDMPELREAILKKGGLSSELQDAVKKAAGVKDGLAHIKGDEMRVTRISEKDLVSVGTPNGPLARAGTGGGKTITNNFWEGKGAFASLRAYEKAKGSMGA
tara:strand:+ start:13145 stop:16396 length:3252 start_codon:yes stop_codon:yes gene_type:complete